MNEIVPIAAAQPPPALVTAAGESAQPPLPRILRRLDPPTQTPARAYARAVGEFLAWCEERGVDSITAIQPLHVAGYVEELTRARSAPTAKQRLAAIRRLFDWLVIGQVVPVNPSRFGARVLRTALNAARRQCWRRRKRGCCWIVLTSRRPLGLRDRALIGLMAFSFARIGGGALHEGGGCLYPASAAVGATAREGRQGPRNALPPCPGGLLARLHRSLRSR